MKLDEIEQTYLDDITLIIDNQDAYLYNHLIPMWIKDNNFKSDSYSDCEDLGFDILEYIQKKSTGIANNMLKQLFACMQAPVGHYYIEFWEEN